MPPFYRHDPFLVVQHALAAPWLDLPMEALSVACEGWAIALIALVAYAALESWRDGWRQALARFSAGWVPLGVGLAVVGWLVHVVKGALRTPRPLGALGPAQVRVLLEPLRQDGFPSGHSAAAAFVAAYAVATRGRRLGWLVALAILGGVSRVYVGAHWVTDVLGGWALGGSLGALAGLALRRRSALRAPAAEASPSPPPPISP